MLIAEYTWVRGSAAAVFCDKPLDHLLLKLRPQVDHVVGNRQAVRDFSRPRCAVQGTARLRIPLVDNGFWKEGKGYPNNLESLLFQEVSGKRAVKPTAHGHKDGLHPVIVSRVGLD